MLVIVETTCETTADAKLLCQALVEKKVVACAQISSGITSIYRWKGDVETSSEVLVRLKTLPHMLKHVESYLKEHHPYETPEIISYSANSSDDYLAWVKENIE